MKRIYKLIRPLFVKLNSYRFFYLFGRFYYNLGLKIFIYISGYFSEIRSIYLRNSFTSNDWIPWESDIDLTIIIADMKIDRELKFLNKFWKFYKVLNFFFPFVKHIDLFNMAEFNNNTMYNAPQLNYLIKDLQLLYGQDHRKTVNYSAEDISSFRIHDWLQFMQWFYGDNLNKRAYAYIRRYYKFFNKILYLSENDDVGIELSQFLLYSKSLNFWLEEPEEFMLKGFYYIIKIFNELYERLDNKYVTSARIRIDNGIEERGILFLEEMGLFVDSLKTMKGHIKSILLIPPSIQNDQYRLWIIINDDICANDFIELVSLIKIKAPIVLKKGIFPYVLTESMVNLFLTTQRLWAFEYFHLLRHAKSVFGEDILNRLNMPSYDHIVRMISDSIPVYRNWLRNLLNNKKLGEYVEALFNVLSWKAFLDRDIIVTDINELISAYKDQHGSREANLIKKFINGQSLDKIQIYFAIKSILDDFSVKKFYEIKHNCLEMAIVNSYI